MRGKKEQLLVPGITALLLFLILYFILKRNDSSPLSKAIAWFSDKLEGFVSVTPSTAIKCPSGYKFFNDKSGASFCCAGKVNPYTHTCEAPAPGGLCAFQPNVQDPRGVGLPVVPLCSTTSEKMDETAAANFCPSGLPNYASKGKCCASATGVDGEDCSPLDLARKDGYCVINSPKPGEQSCTAMKMLEMGSCPSGTTRASYTLGNKERSRYGPSADGLQIPICFSMEGVCIPDEVIQKVQASGIYKDKNVDNWKYSCSGYKKIFVSKQIPSTMDMTYV